MPGWTNVYLNTEDVDVSKGQPTRKLRNACARKKAEELNIITHLLGGYGKRSR